MINLNEYLEWYKKSEVEYWNKKWVFREPKIKDMKLSVMKILEKYCIKGNYKEFEQLINNELPVSKQKDLVETILKELGLA